MREVANGIWHWQAPHPEWNEQQDWPQMVSSYAIDGSANLLIFDPVGLPDELEQLARERETALVLTCPWHRRDSIALAERLDAPIYVPPPDPWDSDPVPGRVFRVGDALPIGVRAFEGREPNDPVLWIESHRALVFGDTLMDRGEGLVFPAFKVENADEIFAGLKPLLDLPVEHVLPAHGEPGDRATLERALA